MFLFPRSDDCPPPPPGAIGGGEPISGSLTFQQIIMIVSWVCFGLSIVLWLALVIPHLRHYNAPSEQRQVLRLVTTPLVFSIFSIASIYSYKNAKYLDALPNLYEAFALASLFLLYVHYVAPEAHTREEFFHKLERKRKNGEIVPGGSLRWFRRTWRVVFFYVLIYTILIIAGEITAATKTTCETSNKAKHGHVWLQALELIATITAMISIIRFQRRLRAYMIDRKALPKLITFKLFVLLSTLQHFIFNIIKAHVTGNAKVTAGDITIGIPAMLLCIEGMLFMLSYHLMFHSNEYKRAQKRSVREMGKAVLHAMNPWDIVHGVGVAFASFRRGKYPQVG